MDLADFLAPMSVEAFRRDHYQRRPLHLPAKGQGQARAAMLDWARLSALLSVPSHWSEANLKLLLDSRAVGADHYLSELRTAEGTLLRADAAKVQMLLGLGASIVANRIEDIDPDVRRIAAMLGEAFGAVAGANAYGSFKGVRAFDSHCDLHEVFAVQLDGEKEWRIYQHRAEAPVQSLRGPGAQAIIDAAKGPVMMTARMKPGDLLYIPRGFYHDALASSHRSLHLTFSVAPLDGRAVIALLGELAVRDPVFREHLPDHRDGGGAALEARLDLLADRVQALLRSDLFAGQMAARQRALAPGAATVDPEQRPRLDQLVRTAAPAQICWHLEGATLRHAKGEVRVGVMAEAAEWAIGQQSFSTLQLATRFGWASDEEVTALIGLLVDGGLFQRNPVPA